jgi:nickel-dependent lactate racemase
MNVEFQFPYGQSFLKAALPEKNIAMVLERKKAAGIPDEKAAIRQALRSPIGSAPLRERVKPDACVAIIVTDNTRACPDAHILPVILEELEPLTPRTNITIILALGLHRPMTEEEMKTKLGADIVDGYRVVNHDAERVVKLGTTSRGNTVEVSRWATEADFRISTGFIEPHFFAGFSGGSKSIAPGVSSANAIRQNHSFCMIEHPLARAGNLQGNPIHEDIVEQARMADLNFIVNVILNEKKQISHVVAGDPVKAHDRGCEIEKSLAGVKVPHKVDITITSNTGAPLDLDLYQACKGIDNAARITREGGIIIMVSACNAGIGADNFKKAHTRASSAKEVFPHDREDGIIAGTGRTRSAPAHAGPSRHDIIWSPNYRMTGKVHDDGAGGLY